MIAAISGLLLCQLLGEVVVRALALPLPGPVAGMGLMFAFLSLRGRRLGEEPGKVPNQIGTVADVLLKNLSLLFIPAATGIVQYFGLVKQFGWIIATSIAISTTAALIVTVMVFRLTAVVGTKRFARPAVREPSAPENEAP